MAQLSWRDVTEIVAGKILLWTQDAQHDGSLDPTSVLADLLHPPFDEMVRFIKKEGSAATPERILEILGPMPMQRIVNAAEEIKLPVDWYTVLKRAASMNEAGRVMSAVAEQLQRGEPTDVSPVMRAIIGMEEGYRRTRFFSEIEPEDVTYEKCGVQFFDKHLGGLPKHGLITIGAPPGVGKTSLVALLGREYVAHYRKRKKKKVVQFFSLEATGGELLTRCLDFGKMPKYMLDQIAVCDEIIPIDEVVAEASRFAAEGLDLILIDFADLIIKGEESEQKMAMIYRGLTALAKNLRIPIVLLSQLNRSYAGGIPKLHNLRYSGMAEALSKVVMFIHNPNNIFTEHTSEAAEKKLPTIPGRGYIVVAKGRQGFGKGHDGPGGIQVKWDGLAGWANEGGTWFPI